MSRRDTLMTKIRQNVRMGMLTALAVTTIANLALATDQHLTLRLEDGLPAGGHALPVTIVVPVTAGKGGVGAALASFHRAGFRRAVRGSDRVGQSQQPRVNFKQDDLPVLPPAALHQADPVLDQREIGAGRVAPAIHDHLEVKQAPDQRVRQFPLQDPVHRHANTVDDAGRIHLQGFVGHRPPQHDHQVPGNEGHSLPAKQPNTTRMLIDRQLQIIVAVRNTKVWSSADGGEARVLESEILDVRMSERHRLQSRKKVCSYREDSEGNTVLFWLPEVKSGPNT